MVPALWSYHHLTVTGWGPPLHRNAVAPIGRRAALVSGLALALALPAGPAAALDPARALTQYVRDAWGLKEGLPQLSVQAMAQTPDGYLWLATEEGLVRFDGRPLHGLRRREPRGLRSQHIEALAVGRRRRALDRDARWAA